MLIGSVCILTGCREKLEDNYRGQQFIAYLGTNVYDLDPAHAYNNKALADIVGLLYDTLFKIDENGKVKPSLAKEYWVEENKVTHENIMFIRLEESHWSNGQRIIADDVVYTITRRALDVEGNNEVAALLYDIKNARKAKEGDGASFDDIGIRSEEKDLVAITFENYYDENGNEIPVDYDNFVRNLASLALAPLKEVNAEKTEDWAKKPATIVCSGPFKLGSVNIPDNGPNDNEVFIDDEYDVEISVGDDDNKKTEYVHMTEPKAFSEARIGSFTIERNPYYRRDKDKDVLNKFVAPYKIICDCNLTDEQIKAGYEAGEILYLNNIPLSLRNELEGQADVSESLSTHSYYFNENALIYDGTETGSKLFAIKEVRQALSMVIDREAIANEIVFAKPATGLVPEGSLLHSESRKDKFRDKCTENYATLNTNADEAKKLLDKAGIIPELYSFSVTVATYDEVHQKIAEMVVAAWNNLGFNVSIKQRGTIKNNDLFSVIGEIPEDICDDLYAEDIREGDFEVIAFDYCALSVDPFSVLAPFAKSFSGRGMDMSDSENYKLTPHITGYDSEAYNALIEKIFAEKKTKNRVDDLLEAEKILMDDMPVVPVVFNQNATVTSKQLKGTEKSFTYSTVFTDVKIKDYPAYCKTVANYIDENFDSIFFFKKYKTKAIIEAKGRTPYEVFMDENTIFSFAYTDRDRKK